MVHTYISTSPGKSNNDFHSRRLPFSKSWSGPGRKKLLRASVHTCRRAGKDRWNTMCASRQRMALKLLLCVGALCISIVMGGRKSPRNLRHLIWRNPKEKRQRQRATAWPYNSLWLGQKLVVLHILAKRLTRANDHVWVWNLCDHTCFKSRR